jgi:hypothetical protein
MRSSTRGILAVLALVVAGGFLAAGRNRSFTVYYAKPATAPSATQTSLDPPSQAVEIEPTPVVPEEKKNTDDDLGMDDINLDDVSLDMDLTAPIVPTPPPPPQKVPTTWEWTGESRRCESGHGPDRAHFPVSHTGNRSVSG